MCNMTTTTCVELGRGQTNFFRTMHTAQATYLRVARALTKTLRLAGAPEQHGHTRNHLRRIPTFCGRHGEPTHEVQRTRVTTMAPQTRPKQRSWPGHGRSPPNDHQSAPAAASEPPAVPAAPCCVEPHQLADPRAERWRREAKLLSRGDEQGRVMRETG